METDLIKKESSGFTLRAFITGALFCFFAAINRWFFVGAPQYPFAEMTSQILHPSGPNRIGWLYKGLGVGVMFFLMFMRNRFLWWPLHPIGFAISPNCRIDALWFTIFFAWFLKTLILRYGGPKRYNSTIPFFLGLILGQYTCAGTWFIIDLFTKMTGNVVFWM